MGKMDTSYVSTWLAVVLHKQQSIKYTQQATMNKLMVIALLLAFISFITESKTRQLLSGPRSLISRSIQSADVEAPTSRPLLRTDSYGTMTQQTDEHVHQTNSLQMLPSEVMQQIGDYIHYNHADATLFPFDFTEAAQMACNIPTSVLSQALQQKMKPDSVFFQSRFNYPSLILHVVNEQDGFVKHVKNQMEIFLFVRGIDYSDRPFIAFSICSASTTNGVHDLCGEPTKKPMIIKQTVVMILKGDKFVSASKTFPIKHRDFIELLNKNEVNVFNKQWQFTANANKIDQRKLRQTMRFGLFGSVIFFVIQIMLVLVCNYPDYNSASMIAGTAFSTLLGAIIGIFVGFRFAGPFGAIPGIGFAIFLGIEANKLVHHNTEMNALSSGMFIVLVYCGLLYWLRHPDVQVVEKY